MMIHVVIDRGNQRPMLIEIAKECYWRYDWVMALRNALDKNLIIVIGTLVIFLSGVIIKDPCNREIDRESWDWRTLTTASLKRINLFN